MRPRAIHESPLHNAKFNRYFNDMDWQIENEIITKSGGILISGVDEAGRGCLAGDVFAAAVILPHGLDIPGLRDSKKMSAAARERLRGVIMEKAVAYAVASASVAEIEEHNILNAALLAMRRAVGALDPQPGLALIDGNVARGFAVPAVCVIGGDDISPNIAAASILAKTARDAYMLEMDAWWPGYGFAAHKGYGTAAHVRAIRELGACAVHRASFLGKIHNS